MTMIERTADSNYIIVGSLNNNIRLLKINPNGDTLWTRILERTGLREWGRFIAQTNDNGFIIIGYCHVKDTWYGDNDILIVKTDSAGNVVSKRLVGEDIFDDVLIGACRAFGTGFMTMYRLYTSGWRFLHVDDDGVPIASCDYDPFFYQPWYICDFQRGNNEYVMTGAAYNGNGLRFWIAGLESSHLGEVWAYYKGDGMGDVGYKVQPTSDGGYIVICHHWTLLKFNGFSVSWQRIYEGDPHYVLPTSDGGYLVTGDKDNDLWLLKTDSLGLLGVEEPAATPSSSSAIEIASSIGSEIVLRYSGCPQGFRASVFDASGRKVDEIYLSQTQGVLTWGGSQPTGVYFIVPEGSNSNPAKVILVR